MKKSFFNAIVFSFLFFVMGGGVTQAQQVIINELFNSGNSNDEWVELLVVQDGVDMRSWDIRDFSSGGVAQNPLRFTTSTLWGNLNKGTLIVVGKSGITTAEDTDPSDYVLVIKANNSLYFAVDSSFLFAGTSDAVQLRDASDTHIFGVSWGTSNASSLPSPKVHFTGSSTSTTAISFNEDSTPELTTTTNWTFNDATPTQGAGNGGNNTSWITSLRAVTDGAGTATINPDTVNHGVLTNFEITYATDASVIITDMRIVVPSNFSWSHDAADVDYTDMTATESVSGDTIYFNNITFNASSTVITINNVTPPDSTSSYPFRVQTKAVTNYATIVSPTNVVVFGVPVDIATIKTNDANGVPLRLGQLVTVRGIMTVGNEFGGPSYIQDNTAGMAIFGSALSSVVAVGDEVIVTGKIEPFNGLFELVSPYVNQIVSSGNEVIPLTVNCSQIAGDGVGGIELYEGLLVRLNGVTVTGSGSWAYQNYPLADASGSTEIRIDNTTNIIGTTIPGSAFDLICVVSQFDNSSPFASGYQLMPRTTTDIMADGPLIVTTPYESDITSSSFKINWTTFNNGTSRLRYGTTSSYELGTVAPDNTERTSHVVDVSGLSAATMYHVQAFSVASAETSFAGDMIVSSASPAGSTGQINVYFNKTVNTSVSNGENANGNYDLLSKVISKINNAKRSIDACIYSLSAANYGDLVAAALIAAKNRGVKVRVISEYDNQSQSGFQDLVAGGITPITDRFDASWFGAGLMHNKFIVFDARGGAPESIWVWTGSWNLTQQGTADDRQNVIEVQDVALANAYMEEFNEMWGSNNDTPNASTTRFGGRKLDNTPHRFNVNGVSMEMYFSPEDKTTSKIGKTLSKAQSSVSAALLTFTRDELGDTVVAMKNRGNKVRVVMDNNTDTGNEYSKLQTAGVDVHLAAGSGLLHHKYALVDAENSAGTPYTITGSHNWSSSAENSNDENTLIVQDARVANLYLQEFAARYYEAGGSDSIRLSLSASFTLSASSFDFDSIDVGTIVQDSFTVTNDGPGILNVASVTSSNARFSVTPTNATVPVSSSQKFFVTFAPTQPGNQTGIIVLVHNAPGSPDTVSVVGYGIDTTTYASIQLGLKNGWNMVSMPATLSSTDKDSVFPTAQSQAFAYQGTYVYHLSLFYGRGYWVKFSGEQTRSFSGVAIQQDTFDLISDWNMIGSISYPVLSNSIAQIPDGIVQTSYFGYDNGYSIADTIQPGKAYWVKVNQAGKLVLAASAFSEMTKQTSQLESLNKIEIVDANGNSSTMYVGAKPNEEFTTLAYELPPLPPNEAFDVRFRNGNMVALINQENGRKEFPISVQGATLPLTIKWTVNDKSNTYSLLTGKNKSVKMNGAGEAKINDAQSLVLKVSDVAIPEVYSLGQNYPNPFNPMTTVSFSLPYHSLVSLKVYNSLGQVVQTVFEQLQFDAGYHDVKLDASSLSSGVYYYRFDASAMGDAAREFHQTKSLMIVK
ncbi:MAG: DUF1573 domain-containing protein [Ignavibacteriae bacterium]|nr:DUF1573 domain-containing protein [Ignavibacteriota bacterium]